MRERNSAETNLVSDKSLSNPQSRTSAGDRTTVQKYGFPIPEHKRQQGPGDLGIHAEKPFAKRSGEALMPKDFHEKNLLTNWENTHNKCTTLHQTINDGIPNIGIYNEEVRKLDSDFRRAKKDMQIIHPAVESIMTHGKPQDYSSMITLLEAQETLKNNLENIKERLEAINPSID